MRVGVGGDPKADAIGQHLVPHTSHLRGHLVIAAHGGGSRVAVQPAFAADRLVPGRALHAHQYVRCGGMPAAQLVRGHLAPLPHRRRGARGMVDEHQRCRSQAPQVSHCGLHLLFAVTAAVQRLAAAEIPLGGDQLVPFLRARRDDQGGVLARGHVEFHAIELDRLGNVGARLQQRGICLVAVTAEWPGPPWSVWTIQRRPNALAWTALRLRL